MQISEKEEYSVKSSNQMSDILKLRKLIRLHLKKIKQEQYESMIMIIAFKTWTYIWTHVDFSKENSIEKTIVAEQGHKKWMGLRDVISNVPAIDCHMAACISNIVLQRIDPIGKW